MNNVHSWFIRSIHQQNNIHNAFPWMFCALIKCGPVLHQLPYYYGDYSSTIITYILPKNVDIIYCRYNRSSWWCIWLLYGARLCVHAQRVSRLGMGGAVRLSRERWSCAGVRVVGVEGGGCRGRRGREPVRGPGGTAWGPRPLWRVAHPVSDHCCLISACVYTKSQHMNLMVKWEELFYYGLCSMPIVHISN